MKKVSLIITLFIGIIFTLGLMPIMNTLIDNSTGYELTEETLNVTNTGYNWTSAEDYEQNLIYVSFTKELDTKFVKNNTDSEFYISFPAYLNATNVYMGGASEGNSGTFIKLNDLRSNAFPSLTTNLATDFANDVVNSATASELNTIYLKTYVDAYLENFSNNYDDLEDTFSFSFTLRLGFSPEDADSLDDALAHFENNVTLYYGTSQTFTDSLVGSLVLTLPYVVIVILLSAIVYVAIKVD